MKRLSTIELFKEEMKFSAGHFTVFSSTVRENLHGHNYNVYAAFTTEIGDEGLSFDYRIYKEKLIKLCEHLNETIIIASHCKYLEINETEQYIEVTFNKEMIPFLKRDVTLLPITNVTVEELSNYFLKELLKDTKELAEHHIHKICIKVFTGPGQSGSSEWEK